MALLNDNLDFTGSLGNLSAYKMHGVEKTVLRSKGGASKKKILKAPEFELTRQNFTEFGACGMMGGSIRRAMFGLVPIADYNFTPSLNKLAKIIQHLDTENKRGQRSVLLSKHKGLLNGFSLNKGISFESIVKHPINHQFNGENAQAQVGIPPLTPGVNLILTKHYPLFRFTVTFGSVTDKVFNHQSYLSPDTTETQCVYSDWYHAGEAFPGTELSIALKYTDKIKDDTSLILAVGIQMGVPLTPSVVNPVKRAGAAKIIAVK